jgi:hypothetical protein
MLSKDTQQEITDNLFKKPTEETCWNCCEYVTVTLAPHLDIPPHRLEIIQKTATAFGYGMGDSAGPCGILSALILLIGHSKGRLDAADADSRILCYELGKELKENIIALKSQIPEEFTPAGGFWRQPDQRMECRRIRIPEEEYSGIKAPDSYCRVFMNMALQAFIPIAGRLV